MAVFWIVAPCSLVERYNPEDSHLRTNRRENLKSQLNPSLTSTETRHVGRLWLAGRMRPREDFGRFAEVDVLIIEVKCSKNCFNIKVLQHFRPLRMPPLVYIKLDTVKPR
jgi:hypothetical protein